MTVHFIGLNSRRYPYTRVRCYEFADALIQQGIPCKVYALSEDYLGDPDERFTNVRDMIKLKVQFQLLKDLFSHVKKGDILYLQKVHHHVAGPFLYSRIKKIPYIIDYDDWDFDRSPFFNHAFLNRLFFGTKKGSDITPRLFSKARCCIASSRYLEKTIAQFNSNVHYLPTGVNLNTFQPKENIGEGKNALVFFWNGDVWGDVILENLFFVFSCLSELVGHKTPWKLQLVVFGDKVARLKRIIHDSYPHLPVEVIENVPPAAMPEYYSRASIGLMPLFSDRYNQDWVQAKSPTKLFEYMAMKLIPVCHNKGEATHIIEHGKNGYLFKNRQECVGILNDLLDNYSAADEIAENAYRTIKNKFSQEVLVKRLIKIIEGIKE